MVGLIEIVYTMTIRLSEYSDQPMMMELFALASEGLRRAGVDQWQNGYPTPEIVRADISRRESYVMVDGHRVVGTAVISFAGEPTYDKIDGEWLTESEAYVVIHRLTIHPELRGGRLAGRLMAHAEELCRQRGVRSMRIDTHADNLPMQRAVLGFGFRYCGVITLADGAPRLAYERPVLL